MHRVYIDRLEILVVTPDFNDAKRTFDKFVREYPDEIIDWDKITDKNASMEDIFYGEFDGIPIRINQCCPY